MPIKFTTEEINNIIKLRTVDKMGIKRIGKVFGVGYKPIDRILRTSGIDTSPIQTVKLTDSEKTAILKAYDDGIGCKGIPQAIGLDCSAAPVISFIESERGELRNRSEQQQARMDRSTPSQRKQLTANANIAAIGRKKTLSEQLKSARTKEGVVNSRSKYESLVLDTLRDCFEHVTPSKAIHIFNADFAIGNVTVEVFGGGWSISDITRVEKYIRRTKQIGELGYHVIFIILRDSFTSAHASKLVSSIDIASTHPSDTSKYWVIWGDLDGSTGLCSDIDKSAFICPFVNARDTATGRYKSIPR